MLNKTKAALQSCQCHYEKPKRIKHTRVNAGGQSLSAPVITGTAPLARLGGMPKSGYSHKGYTNFFAHLQTTQKLGCLGCTDLAQTLFPQIWGELDQLVRCTAMQHTQSPEFSGDAISKIVSCILKLRRLALKQNPEKSRSFDRYPVIGYRCEEYRISQNHSYENSGGQIPEDFQSAFMHFGYHSLSTSLAFLRWRRLISPFTAVTMNCAFVSPSSRLLSKSATTSCGKRALSCCDLLLVEPVAIPESPCARCDSVYAKKIIVKGLKCDSLACSFKNKGAIHLVSAKPGSASTLTGPLTTKIVNVSRQL